MRCLHHRNLRCYGTVDGSFLREFFFVYSRYMPPGIIHAPKKGKEKKKESRERIVPHSHFAVPCLSPALRRRNAFEERYRGSPLAAQSSGTLTRALLLIKSRRFVCWALSSVGSCSAETPVSRTAALLRESSLLESTFLCLCAFGSPVFGDLAWTKKKKERYGKKNKKN